MNKLLTVLVSILLIQIIGMPSSNADGNFPQGDTNCNVQSSGVYCSVEIVYVNANGATFPTSFIWYYSKYQGGDLNLVSSYGPKVEIGSTSGNGAGFTFEDLLGYAAGNPNGVIFISVANRWVGTNSSGGALTITNPNGKGTYFELAKLPALIEKAKLESSVAADKAAADKAAADKAAAESKAKLDKAAQEATDAANEAINAGNNANNAADKAMEAADAATIAAQASAASAAAAGEMAVEAAEAAGVIAQDALDAANAATDAALSAAEAADAATAAATEAKESADAVFEAANGLNSKLDFFVKSCQIRVSNAISIYQRMKVARGL